MLSSDIPFSWQEHLATWDPTDKRLARTFSPFLNDDGPRQRDGKRRYCTLTAAKKTAACQHKSPRPTVLLDNTQGILGTGNRKLAVRSSHEMWPEPGAIAGYRVPMQLNSKLSVRWTQAIPDEKHGENREH